MTEARMDWGKMKIEISGHAGAGKKGQDIVCAAESMLVGALIRSLEIAKNRGRTEFGYKEGPEGSGEITIWANPWNNSVTEVKAYFKMAVNGMKMLAEQYPEYVKIREV